MKKNNQKAQGAIEYLLIIGAAILVIAIVSISLVGLTTSGMKQTDSNTVNEANQMLTCQKECIKQGATWDGRKCSTLITGDHATSCNTYNPN